MARRQPHISTNEIDTTPVQAYGAVIDATGDAVTVPYGTMLLDAAFSRQGPDLLLTGEGAETVLVRGYFAAEDSPALLTEGGAKVSPDTAEALAGPAAPGQHAQAGPSGAQQPIGTVDTADGEVFATRADGTRVSLAEGDSVFQGDVLETDGEGALSVTFADGTEFSLDENARMVLDELVYDPGTGEGSSSFTVVQGVFSFVSGAIAKAGPDAMTVDTPVATIGIRGTKVAIKAGAEGEDTVISLLEEEGGQTGEISITNEAGSQILNVANQTVFVESAFLAPAAPTILPSAQIRSLFNSSEFDVFSARPAAGGEDRAETLEEQVEAAREEAGEEGAEDEDIEAAEAAAEIAYELALADGLDEDEALEAAEEAFVATLGDGAADGLIETAAGGDDGFTPQDGTDADLGGNTAFAFDPAGQSGNALGSGAPTAGGATGSAQTAGVAPETAPARTAAPDPDFVTEPAPDPDTGADVDAGSDSDTDSDAWPRRWQRQRHRQRRWPQPGRRRRAPRVWTLAPTLALTLAKKRGTHPPTQVITNAALQSLAAGESQSRAPRARKMRARSPATSAPAMSTAPTL